MPSQRISGKEFGQNLIDPLAWPLRGSPTLPKNPEDPEFSKYHGIRRKDSPAESSAMTAESVQKMNVGRAQLNTRVGKFPQRMLIPGMFKIQQKIWYKTT